MNRKENLYDPRFEHDACGIGAVVSIDGRKSHDTVDDALRIVEQLEHRAGKDATGETGDGVGILLQIPHAFFQRAAAECGITLGEVRYLGSQPWPFPASLMVAFKAYALDTRICTDGDETVDAHWVSRDELTDELVRGRITMPNRAAIARYMIEEWYGRSL